MRWAFDDNINTQCDNKNNTISNHETTQRSRISKPTNIFSSSVIRDYRESEPAVEKQNKVEVRSVPQKQEQMQVNNDIQNTKWVYYPVESHSSDHQFSPLHQKLLSITVPSNKQKKSLQTTSSVSSSTISLPSVTPIDFNTSLITSIQQLSEISGVISGVEYNELLHRKKMWMESPSVLSERNTVVEKEYDNYLSERNKQLTEYIAVNHLFEKEEEKTEEMGKEKEKEEKIEKVKEEKTEEEKEVMEEKTEEEEKTEKTEEKKEEKTEISSENKQTTNEATTSDKSASKSVTEIKEALEIAHKKIEERTQQALKKHTTPLPANQLTEMYQELLLLLNSYKVDETTRKAIRKETRELVGVLNLISMNQEQLKSSSQTLLERLKAVSNPQCQVYLIYFITDNLLQKGRASCDFSVCLSYAYLLCQLASEESRFINMILAGLFFESPFLVPVLPKQKKTVDSKTFDKEVTQLTRLVCIFAGLFIYTPLNQKKVYPIRLAWEWIETIIDQQKSRKSDEFADLVYIFLQMLNKQLHEDDSERLTQVLNDLETLLPSLERIPEKTAGSIMRLESLLKKLQKGELNVPEFCLLN